MLTTLFLGAAAWCVASLVLGLIVAQCIKTD